MAQLPTGPKISNGFALKDYQKGNFFRDIHPVNLRDNVLNDGGIPAPGGVLKL